MSAGRGHRGTTARLATLLAATCLAHPAGAATLDPATFEDVSLDVDGDGTAELPGRLLVPEAALGSRAPALVVHLHGSGSRGADNVRQLDGQLAPLAEGAEAAGYLLYAPQTWDSWSEARLADVARVASGVARDRGADPRRIYLTGISMGGGGAWVAMTGYEGGYAAAIPMAGPAYGDVRHTRAVGVPIWNFHSRGDTSVSVWHSRNNVNGVYASASLPLPQYPSAGPDYFFEQNGLRLTELDGTRHLIAGQVLGAGSDAETWLLARRNDRAPLRVGETIRFDFGDTVAGTIGGLTWNHAGGEHCAASCVASPFVRTSAHRGTGVCLRAGEAFDGAMAAGHTFAIVPQAVAEDGWIVGSDEGHEAACARRGVVVVDGLDPCSPYRLEVYGSWNDDDGGRGRIARYSVGDQQRDLDLAWNSTGRSVFERAYADREGRIEVAVGVAPGSAARWASINAMWITPVERPCAADTNADDAVDIHDFAILLGNFGTVSGATRSRGDLDDDGDVDTADFAVLAADFGCGG